MRVTIDLPDDLHTALRQRAVAQRIYIRSLITRAIESELAKSASRRVTGPLVGKRKGTPAAGSPEGKNPYDILFA
jgi:hypothetical protein